MVGTVSAGQCRMAAGVSHSGARAAVGVSDLLVTWVPFSALLMDVVAGGGGASADALIACGVMLGCLLQAVEYQARVHICRVYSFFLVSVSSSFGWCAAAVCWHGWLYERMLYVYALLRQQESFAAMQKRPLELSVRSSPAF